LKEKIEQISDERSKKKLKTCLKKIKKEVLPRKKKYEKAKRTFGKRNSYSQTDPDATFMRMKDDRMGNSQLQPGYNIQIGTEDGFIIGYDLFPNPTDTKTLKPHLKRQAKRLGVKPKVVIADAGYGGEENYRYLESRQTTAVIKYGTYYKEKSRKWTGKKLIFREIKKKTTGSGFPITADRYECESCKYCRLKKKCTKSKGNRSVERNERWLRLKKKAQRILESEHYEDLRKRRSVEVETVFGQIKGNQGFRRFLLRGMEKASTEWGLLSLGYNFKQLFRLNRENTA